MLIVPESPPEEGLTGDLKEKVEKAENKEEAKKVIEQAGMVLTEEELDEVAGGTREVILPSVDVLPEGKRVTSTTNIFDKKFV